MKRALTLLEVLLVIALIGFTISITGFQIASFLKEHHFKSSVQIVLNKFYFARALSRDLGSDMSLTITIGKDESQIILESDLPLTTREVLAGDLRHELKEISSLEFNGQKVEKITFRLNQNGYIEPIGDLLFYKKGSQLKTRGIKVSSSPEIKL